MFLCLCVYNNILTPNLSSKSNESLARWNALLQFNRDVKPYLLFDAPRIGASGGTSRMISRLANFHWPFTFRSSSL